jgi:DNA-directed RNA polymerase subunit RPC12/RpoP
MCVSEMSERAKLKRFSCVNCGSHFELHPPDDLHTTASRVEKECDQSVKMDYKCKNCGKTNTIHWCRRSRYPDWYA